LEGGERTRDKNSPKRRGGVRDRRGPSQARHRILYMDLSVRFGGTVVSLLSALKETDAEKYAPIVLCRTGFNSEVFENQGVQTESLLLPRFPRKSKVSLFGLRFYSPFGLGAHIAILCSVLVRTLRIHHRERLDLVQGSGLYSNFYASVAGMLLGKPVVWYLNDFDLLRNRRLFLALQGRISAIIAISEGMKRRLLDCGFEDEKTTVIYESVDSEDFRPLDRGACRRELGLNPSDVCVGFVGRLDRGKGIEVFLEAASHIAGRHTTAMFLVAGKGEDQSYVKQIRLIADRPALKGRVIWLGFRRDIPKVMNALDVLVVPSTNEEGFGLVAAEAGACAVPVVVSDSGGLKEIVLHNETGLIVPTDSAESFAASVSSLLEDRERLSQMGAAARRRAGAVFSPALRREKIESIYAEILH
jgi:glycosyltransferase involved in cell wall biosynthesis